MTIRVERVGPYTYLVVGADRFLLTVDDAMRIGQELSRAVTAHVLETSAVR